MPRQLILAVGLHKTGTTSIQQTCARNRRVLRDAGFLYPRVSVSGQGQTTANHTGTLHFMFRRQPEKFGYSRGATLGERDGIIEVGNQIREAFASQLLTQATNLLMVAEGASLFSVDELGDMKRWFNDRNWDVRVICFVRWLSSWINSMVSQRVTGFQHLTIQAAVGQFLDVSGAVQPWVTNIRKAFPDAELYSYEAASRHRLGLVGFFLEAIGIRPTEKMIFARANAGRSDCATRLISSINAAFGPGLGDGTVNPHYAGNGISRLNAIPGAKFSLRLDEAAPLLPLLRAENEWLKKTLGEQFYDPRLEFGAGRVFGQRRALPACGRFSARRRPPSARWPPRIWRPSNPAILRRPIETLGAAAWVASMRPRRP